MSTALELRSVYKRFFAGAGACLASAAVLRGVDLVLDMGESIAIVGPAGVGKSTLMLCSAGLLKVESGILEWFGDTSPATAARRAHYYYSPADLLCGHSRDEPQLHLLDLHPSFGTSASFGAWIDDRCAHGDSVIVAAREERFVCHSVNRVLTLSGGILRSRRPMHSRVAECATG